MNQMEEINENIPAYVEKSKGGGSKWQDDAYDDCMRTGNHDPEAIYEGDLGIKKQSGLLTEFMKVLCLAHGCVAEVSTVDDSIFYNGESPDEVALVEYAQSMQFECTLSDDHEVKATIPIPGAQASQIMDVDANQGAQKRNEKSCE